MNTKIILIILGEPNSTFSEILLKYFISKNFKKNKKKIVLIGSKKLFESQMKLLNYKINLNKIDDLKDAIFKSINILNVDFNFKKVFSKITKNSNEYIEKCFNLGLNLVRKYQIKILINGPVSKKSFLNKKFLGITEYVAKKTNSKSPVMLIYNKQLSVSPLTTHVPIKNVSKYIQKKKIVQNVTKINNFYKKNLFKKPIIGILGLNPHCETVSKISEEDKEIIQAIKLLKQKKIKVSGPFPADTFFTKKNIESYDVVVGMYHDQVLTPIKLLFEFEAINLTIGLPFIKITPDHGPNYSMIGKNNSDPSSIFCAFNFIKNIK